MEKKKYACLNHNTHVVDWQNLRFKVLTNHKKYGLQPRELNKLEFVWNWNFTTFYIVLTLIWLQV